MFLYSIKKLNIVFIPIKFMNKYICNNCINNTEKNRIRRCQY